MPVFDKNGATSAEIAPGILRVALLDGLRGSESITISEVTVGPGVTSPVHYHPTEEAMLIAEGELDAIVGDDVFHVIAGQIVVAPPTVTHGFVNRSNAPAIVYGIHPTNDVVTIVVS